MHLELIPENYYVILVMWIFIRFKSQITAHFDVLRLSDWIYICY